MARYLILWLGFIPLAFINGGLREMAYGPHVNPLAAHQISTFTACLLFYLYARYIFRRWPLASRGQAIRVGLVWGLLTVLFESGLIYLLTGGNWGFLLHTYNIFAGQMWPVLVLWVVGLPLILFKAAHAR